MTSPDPLEAFVRVGFFQEHAAIFDHALWCGETFYGWTECPRVDMHRAQGDQAGQAIREDMQR